MAPPSSAWLDLPYGEPFAGHRGCAGCAAALAARLVLKAIGPDHIAVIPAGCLSAIGFVWPQMAFSGNAMIAPFAATAAVLSGVAAASRALGWRNQIALGLAGDGGTADIGLQALSGAIDRAERILYVCYDNEGYMNTGAQRSGLTPNGARTATSPGAGNTLEKKNLFGIVVAHRPAYAATASVSHPDDLVDKVRAATAAIAHGTAFIHLLAPCPTGWGVPPAAAVDIAGESVACGLWPLLVWQENRLRVTQRPASFAELAPHLRRQGRFRHLDAQAIARIAADRDRRWRELEAAGA